MLFPSLPLPGHCFLPSSFFHCLPLLKTSFSHFLRIGLLIAKPFHFPLSENDFISSFPKDNFTIENIDIDIEFVVDRSLFQDLKKGCAISFWPLCFRWEVSCHSHAPFLYIMGPKKAGSCQDFFVFSSQKFSCDVFWPGFLWLHTLEGSFDSLNLQLCFFCQNWENFSYCIFGPTFFFLLCIWDSDDMNVASPLLSYRSLGLSSLVGIFSLIK